MKGDVKMNSKRIIILSITILLAIVLVGIVFSSSLNSNGKPHEGRIISIENVEFNIPVEYEKNQTKSIVNQSRSMDNNSYVLNQETFENDDGKEIIISIADYDDFDVDSGRLQMPCRNSTQKTLMGYPGYIRRNKNNTEFAYVFDHRLVSVTAFDEDMIKQVLVVEDA